jgi:hypothetical protein
MWRGHSGFHRFRDSGTAGAMDGKCKGNRQMSERAISANQLQQARTDARDAYKQIVIPWLKALCDRIDPILQAKVGQVEEDIDLVHDVFQARCGNSRAPDIRRGSRFQATAFIRLRAPATWTASVEIVCSADYLSKPYKAELSGTLPLENSEANQWFPDQLTFAEAYLRENMR